MALEVLKNVLKPEQLVQRLSAPEANQDTAVILENRLNKVSQKCRIDADFLQLLFSHGISKFIIISVIVGISYTDLVSHA